jgi:L-rhamnose mutarotase
MHQNVWTLVRLHDDDYSSECDRFWPSVHKTAASAPILPYSIIMFGMKSVMRNWVVHWGQRSAPFFTAKPVNAA